MLDKIYANDLSFKYENVVRKIFQCGRFEDPYYSLADASDWDELKSAQFSKKSAFKVWAVLSRLRSQYLCESEGRIGREALYEKAMLLEDELLKANTNNELTGVMNEITNIVGRLKLSEFPHISYKATNEKIID